jgi:hypothetical protein
MCRITEKLLALAAIALLTNATTAQVTVNGRPIVTNPRQQINSAQTNRVFGGLNIAVPALPPAGQAVTVNGPALNPNPPAMPMQSPLAVSTDNAASGAAPLATQGYLVAGSAPYARWRPLSAAEYNRLFGGLNQGAPTLPTSVTPGATPAPGTVNPQLP